MSASILCLCRPGGLAVEGLAQGASSNEVAVTIQGDGVVTFDVEQQTRTAAWVLGNKAARFCGPVAFVEAADCLVSAVRNLAGGASAVTEDDAAGCSAACTIVCSPASGSNRLLDSQQRLPAGGPVFALHPLPCDEARRRAGAQPRAASFAAAEDSAGPLSSGGGGAETAVAVVLEDATVAALLVAAGGKHARFAGGRPTGRGRRACAAAVGPAGLYVVSSSTGQPRQQQQQHYYVDVFELKADSLRRKGGFQLTPPAMPTPPSLSSSAAGVLSAAVVGSRVAIVWSDGTLQSYQSQHLPDTQQDEGAAADGTPPDALQPSVSVMLRGLAFGPAPPSVTTHARGANGKLLTPGGKKKRSSSADALEQQQPQQQQAGAAPIVAVVPLQQDMVAVVGWQAAGHGLPPQQGSPPPSWAGGLSIVAVDVRYGALRLQQRLREEGGEEEGSAPASALVAAGGAGGMGVCAVALGGGRLAVAAGGAVFSAEVRAGPVSLAALVGSAAAAGAHQQQQRQGQQQSQQQQQQHAGVWGMLQAAPDFYDAAATAGGAWSGQLAVPQDARWDTGSSQRAQAEDAACGTRLHQLTGEALDAESDRLLARCCSGPGPPPSPALAAAAAARLAEARRWDALGRLLASAAAPRRCPGLLPALADACRYDDMAVLLARGVDIGAQDLASALSHLLRCPAGPEQEAAQQRFHARLTGGGQAADGDVHTTAVANGLAAGSKSKKKRRAVAAAAAAKQTAAAGADPDQDAAAATPSAVAAPNPKGPALLQLLASFPARESALHPLVAPRHDAAALAAALRALPASAALALAGYLARWLGWYSGGLVAAAPLSPVGPLPCLQAAVDWAAALLDAQLMPLAMQARSAAAGVPREIEALRAAVESHVSVARKASGLHGALQHLAVGAPLPLPRAALAMHYSVELLDLSIHD